MTHRRKALLDRVRAPWGAQALCARRAGSTPHRPHPGPIPAISPPIVDGGVGRGNCPFSRKTPHSTLRPRKCGKVLLPARVKLRRLSRLGTSCSVRSRRSVTCCRIDQSFVRDLETDEADRVITQAAVPIRIPPFGSLPVVSYVGRPLNRCYCPRQASSEVGIHEREILRRRDPVG